MADINVVGINLDNGQAKCVTSTDTITDSNGTPLITGGSDWITGTFTGTWVANTTYTGDYRIVGPGIIQCRVAVALSGAPVGNFSINPPTGYTLDTPRLLVNITSTPLGSAYTLDSGTARYGPYMVAESAGVLRVFRTAVSGSNIIMTDIITATAPFTYANGDTVMLDFTIPVTAS